MVEQICTWISTNWVETTGTILGLNYIILSIKQHILTWPIGLASSVFYVYIFFASKFYADMSLQLYYVWVSIYGWILWGKRKKQKTSASESRLSETNEASETQETDKTAILNVTHVTKKMLIEIAIISAILTFAIYFILSRYTDSSVPFGDALTTALSIVATWMMARKILEHWIFWVFIDFMSLCLYLYKGLYATTILFAVYTISAIIGYFEWRKSIHINSAETSSSI